MAAAGAMIPHSVYYCHAVKSLHFFCSFHGRYKSSFHGVDASLQLMVLFAWARVALAIARALHSREVRSACKAPSLHPHTELSQVVLSGFINRLRVYS
jgi:hypothetical protein